jgi:hypothetical protein
LVLSSRSRAGAVVATWCEVHSRRVLVRNLCSEHRSRLLRRRSSISSTHCLCRFCSPKTCTITPGNAQCAACGFHDIMFFATLSVALPQTPPSPTWLPLALSLLLQPRRHQAADQIYSGSHSVCLPIAAAARLTLAFRSVPRWAAWKAFE